MRIYISGPITGVPDYMERFEKAEQKLYERGHDVVNPAKVGKHLEAFSYDEIIDIDLMLLSKCQAIYLLDGWTQSAGAKKELLDALRGRKDIITESGKELEEYVANL